MKMPKGEETIFTEALRLPPKERRAYVAQATEDNPELRRRVEALLGNYEDADFLEEAADPELRKALWVPVTEKPGDIIGRYRLLEQIGEGGCGVVYVAEQFEPVRRRVALKIIKLGMDSRSVIARFEAERQALALMDHPNIAKVFDAGATETGRPYFVMELVRGMKITDYCDQAKLSTHSRLDLFIQVCQAIQHAHQKGIIHRDIKPSNILVTVNDGVPVPKVIDFGIAKATGGQQLTATTVYTAFEQFIGTPAYMSPEQAMLTSLDVDTRSDIYALGVLLYELLTGKTPFDARELLAIGIDEMRRTIREQEPPRPSTRLSTLACQELSTAAQRRGLDAPKLVSEIRGDLDWIVMKAMEKDRARRYETASGFAADIQRHLKSEPVIARPASKLYRFQRTVRRNRIAFSAAVAVATALVGAVIVSAWQAQRAKTERDSADAVLKFFQDKVLAAGRPEGQDGGLGKGVTLRRAIDAAEQQITETFQERPVVEAAIRHSLGYTYAHLGEYTLALTQFDRALALRRQHLGLGNTKTLGTMHQLGMAYRSAGKYDQAISLLEEAFELSKARLGPDHGTTLDCMNNLALAYGSAGNYDKQLYLAEEGYKLRKAKRKPDDTDLLKSMSNLALAYISAGKADQAVPILENALGLWRDKRGPDHLDTARAMTDLSLAYSLSGKSNQALTLLEEALKVREAKLGLDHSSTLATMSDLAAEYRNARKLDRAISLYEQTINLQKAKQGPDHPDTLRSMRDLALAYLWANKPDQAIGLFEATLKLQRAKLKPDHPDTLYTLHNLAVVYRDTWNLEKALPLFEEEFNIKKAQLGSDNLETIRAMGELGALYVNIRKLDQAVPLLERTIELMELKVSSNDRHLLSTMHNLGVAYGNAGKLDLAEALLEKTLKRQKEQLPPDDPNVQSTIAKLGGVYWAAGRPDRAISLLDETFKLRKEKLGALNPSTLGAMQSLAIALQRQRRYEEADQLFDEVLIAAAENKQLSDKQLSAELLMLRGDLRGKRGELNEAAADFAKGIELNPDDHRNWHGLALLLAASGQIEKYREHCRESSKRFSNTSDPLVAGDIAIDCLILPGSGADLELVAKMADIAAAATNHWAFSSFQFVKSLSEYRRARFVNASEWARKTLAQAGEELERDVAAFMVLAMAHHHLKEFDEAQAALAKGSEIEQIEWAKGRGGELIDNWDSRVVAQVLLREAEALIKSSVEAFPNTQ
jgi:serine/threonine protein kinase/Tfp pilus assembly protein PilF